MINWFVSNLGNISVLTVLTGAVALIIANLRNRKKQGLSSCGCNCSNCALGGSCHQK